MFLHKKMEAKISLFSGSGEFKKQMDMVKKTQPLSKRYIFDIWIVYVDILKFDPNLEVAEDVENLKYDIENYLFYFEEILKIKEVKVISLCVEIMKLNLDYVRNLRLLSS